MAKNRGAANLAGLAALGALGYMLRDKQKASMGGGDESVFTGPMEVSPEYTRAVTEGLKTEGPESVGGSTRDFQSMEGVDLSTRQPKRVPRSAPKTVSKTPSVTDTGDETSRLASRYPTKNVSGTLSRAERLAREAERPLAERQAEAREQFLKSSPLITAPRAVGQFFEGADRRYLQSKLDRGETLTPMEKAQAKRAGMEGFRKGGAVKAKKMASGGMTRSSASKRADGIATKGKTRGKIY